MNSNTQKSFIIARHDGSCLKFQHSAGRGKQISVILRPGSSIEKKNSGQPGVTQGDHVLKNNLHFFSVGQDYW